MAKSKIIKEIAIKEISLEVAFNRLLIIASDIKNEELLEWAKNELNGYSDSSGVPNYRECGIGQILYSGINGSYKVTKLPLPYGAIDEDLMKQLRTTKFPQDICTIEKFASEDDSGIGKDLTDLAGVVLKNTGIQCLDIYMKFTKETFLGILSSIRTKLLEVFIELDREFGNLDELDIEIEGKNLKELNKKINIIIFDNSISIGDQNKLKNNLFGKIGGKK